MAAPDIPTTPTPDQRRGMRSAIFAQCCGCVAVVSLTNGILLLYLHAIGLDSSEIIMALAVPVLCEAIPRLPFAHLADRYGKKLFGYIGVALTVLGFVLITSAAVLPATKFVVLVGLGCYGVGYSAFGAGWFALLSPVVPAAQRGRFFGTLRVSWQSVGIAFTAICTLILGQDTPLPVFIGVLLAITILLAMRGVFYMNLPELEPSRRDSPPFFATLRQLLPVNNYASFCCYVFLLSLLTGAAPSVFGLLEKDALGLGDRTIVMLGNLTMVGAVCGYFLGGKAVDRYSTKPVFLACHFGYSMALLGFLFRDAIPGGQIYLLSALHLLFGLVYAGSSIAISSEMLALIPPQGKALSTSLLNTMLRAGIALSGILSGWALSLGLLSSTWQLGGYAMTAYDTILMAFGVMMLLIIVTLGLVPSVIGKSQWYPRGS